MWFVCNIQRLTFYIYNVKDNTTVIIYVISIRVSRSQKQKIKPSRLIYWFLKNKHKCMLSSNDRFCVLPLLKQVDLCQAFSVHVQHVAWPYFPSSSFSSAALSHCFVSIMLVLWHRFLAGLVRTVSNPILNQLVPCQSGWELVCT